jgi:hypothetical protein
MECSRLLGRNSQPLASLRAATFENNPPVLGTHTHPETVCSAAAAAIWLKRALHLTPGWVTGTLEKLES